MPQTPVVGAQTIHPNNEVHQTPQIQYSEAATKYINFRRQRMIAARDMRDSQNQKWDDMPFLKWYEVMEKADDQYVAPRKNAQDTSINTGTIRDKDTTLVEYAMKYDFEPVAQVYDDSDDLLEDLAETGEDLVRKSFIMEEYQRKAKLIYRSMVTFGTALVEDAYIERWTIEKEFGKGFSIGDKNATWTEKRVKSYDGCQTKLWDLRKCYFGDIRKFFMNGPQGQPYVFTVEYESMDVLQQYFGDWDRWVNVPKTIVYTPEVSTAQMYAQGWTLRPISMNYGEIIRYYDPIANEFSLTINGVDMLPILETKTTGGDGLEKVLVSGFPLTAISPSGAIPFAKYDLEPMHDFAYSKSQPGKMRVWGDIENMFVKLMIRQYKQKTDPTLGNKSGRQFGSEATDPATIINDIREGDLFPILPNFQGPGTADFSMYEMVKKELDKNSVERSFQGMDNPSPQDETATKEMNDMKAQSLKVAALFDGIIGGNQQLYWLRLYNIAKNWTKPVDVRVDLVKNAFVENYRTVHLPTEVDGGQKALKKIVFTKDTGTKTSEDVLQEQMDYAKANGGKEVRISYLHPEQFSAMRFKWFFTAVPVPNDSDPLSYMMFAKQITDAATFFGPESMNVKKLKHRFAKLTGTDFDTWFIKEQELQQKQAAAAAAAGPGGAVPTGKPNAMNNNTVNPSPSIAGAARGAAPSMAAVMQ